jgi:hypothetical protein
MVVPPHYCCVPSSSGRWWRRRRRRRREHGASETGAPQRIRSCERRRPVRADHACPLSAVPNNGSAFPLRVPPEARPFSRQSRQTAGLASAPPPSRSSTVHEGGGRGGGEDDLPCRTNGRSVPSIRKCEIEVEVDLAGRFPPPPQRRRRRRRHPPPPRVVLPV